MIITPAPEEQTGAFQSPTPEKSGRRKKFLLIGLLIVIGGLIVWSNVWKSNLTVSEVTVEGNRIVDANEILQLAHITEGALMYNIELTEIQKNVSSNFFIKDAIVERDLPSTIHIQVIERSPMVMVNRGQIQYLDEDGVVLPHSISKETFDLPILSGLPAGVSLKAGTAVTHVDVQEALDILIASRSVSNEMYHMISEIRLRDGGDIVLYAAERGVPIIFGRGEAASKMVRLETFWNEVVRQRGAQQLLYVDLRFDDQIVVRWKS
ncbi:MAG: FtsQ-type POTRA domain-containing protein [Ignavibacteriae bacterium]|nr:FtsQ-type POTRA domain-containing protein [Ignavibacteriota bacterium]